MDRAFGEAISRKDPGHSPNANRYVTGASKRDEDTWEEERVKKSRAILKGLLCDVIKGFWSDFRIQNKN